MLEHTDKLAEMPPEGTPDDSLRLDVQLCFAVYAAAHALTRRYKPLLEAFGLTYPQYLVMMVLWETDDLSLKAIGQRLDLDSGTLTPMLKRLEAAGWVSRRRDATDERSIRVTLTDAGRDLRQNALSVPTVMACATGLDTEQVRALRGELERLRRSLLDGAV